MAKIAVELEHALAHRSATGAPGSTAPEMLARGDGWSVADVVCTSGPPDRLFEERHSKFVIAIVAVGTFQYRCAADRELMTPGSLLLGNPGQCFECGHEHGWGDRCLSFWYTPEYFERIEADAGVRSGSPAFRVFRLPPMRALAPVVARACAGLAGAVDPPWEEIGVQLAAHAVQLVGGYALNPCSAPAGALARVTRAVRAIDRHPEREFTLGTVAREAGLSPYHFLRTFQRVTGVTPHRYLLRARLHQAAMRLEISQAKVLDVALDCGFGDVSNFNRAFRAEFGVNPRAYRIETGAR